MEASFIAKADHGTELLLMTQFGECKKKTFDLKTSVTLMQGVSAKLLKMIQLC